MQPNNPHVDTVLMFALARQRRVSPSPGQPLANDATLIHYLPPKHGNPTPTLYAQQALFFLLFMGGGGAHPPLAEPSTVRDQKHDTPTPPSTSPWQRERRGRDYIYINNETLMSNPLNPQRRRGQVTLALDDQVINRQV